LRDGTFWLSETPEKVGSKGWDAALPRIMTWVKLKDLRGMLVGASVPSTPNVTASAE